MIVRVYGTINGRDLLPFLNVGERYYFPVPPTLTGKYVCEFWAEDDFGNTGYNSAILTLEKGIIKCVEVIASKYRIAMLRDPYHLDISEYPYKARMIPISCRRDMMEVF
jgi:hypothetical protein